MNKIGVMQGRLLPKYLGRYQAHPINYWKDEFFIAKEIGLDCIEFILDYNDANSNPLLTDDGVKEINSAVQDSSIEVKTICADYFMEAPLHSFDSSVVKTSQVVMKTLLDNANKIGVSDIVIPCVDQSSLEGKDAAKRFVRNLKPMLIIAEKYGINLSLETDLAPGPFVDLLDRFNSHKVKVNYDIGNSAALGYDLSHCTASAFSPLIATLLVQNHGVKAPGLLYPLFAVLTGSGMLISTKIYRYGGVIDDNEQNEVQMATSSKPKLNPVC